MNICGKYTIEQQTEFGEAIDPSWDPISCETHAGIIAEMVAVPSDEMVGVAGVLPRHLLHQQHHFISAQRRPSD